MCKFMSIIGLITTCAGGLYILYLGFDFLVFTATNRHVTRLVNKEVSCFHGEVTRVDSRVSNLQENFAARTDTTNHILSRLCRLEDDLSTLKRQLLALIVRVDNVEPRT